MKEIHYLFVICGHFSFLIIQIWIHKEFQQKISMKQKTIQQTRETVITFYES